LIMEWSNDLALGRSV